MLLEGAQIGNRPLCRKTQQVVNEGACVQVGREATTSPT